MRSKKWIGILVVLVLLIAAVGFLGVRFYSYVFAETVNGVIIKVEHITTPGAIVGANAQTTSTMFSFAIAIQTKDGEIHTASSEDRQWAVAEKGQCATAKFYPYPHGFLINPEHSSAPGS